MAPAHEGTQSHDEPVGLESGKVLLDRYIIERRIDAGGHSVVYRAQDKRLHRPVCIKVFHWLEMGSPIYKATYHKFIQEAQALARLQHPNTLRLYDFGYLPGETASLGAPFQVSEFMDAGSVYQRVRTKGPLPREEVMSLVRSICSALDEAHEAGIVHRDIKPKNILLTMAGSRWIAKLADFGIAKTEDWGDDTAIVAGMPMLLFSPLWAAPEQLSASKVSPATDVYSMALLVVFLLTGRFVFTERKPAPAREERSRASGLVSAAFRGSPVPTAMVDVLRKAVSFDPAGRQQTASAFADELTEASTGEWTAGTYTPPPPSRSLRPRRVSPADGPIYVDGRELRFVIDSGPTVLGDAGARFDVQHIPRGAQGFVLQVRGRDCFVARDGGRPTSTVQLSASGEVDLITPSRNNLGRIRVDFGRIAAGHRVFEIANEAIAVGADDAKDAVAIHLAAEQGFVIKGRK